VPVLPVDCDIVVVTVKVTSVRAVRVLITAEAFFQPVRKWTMLAAFWARALGAAAAGLVLIAATIADVPAARGTSSSFVSLTPDPRIVRLERFFKIYHCATPYYTHEYLRAADSYGLDYRLLPAISIRETQCGITAKDANNTWGYHPGRQSFPSIGMGIDFIAKRLARHPLYEGKTLKDKLFTYNPRDAYPEEVKRIMRQIE
jgi:hypothetical protein